jgi:rhodanese-related sulfurtransferase
MSMTIAKPDTQGAKNYFTAKNKYTTGPVEVSHMMDENLQEAQIIDVRASEDYRRGHIPGAVNLPRDQWDNPQNLSKDKTNILYCYNQTCHLAAKAGMILAAKGYPVMEMEGGFETWEQKGLEVEK